MGALPHDFRSCQSDRNRTITPSPKIFSAVIDRSLIADTDEVEHVERSGGATLIDARSVALFLGKSRAEPAQALRAYSRGHQPRQL